MLKRIMRRAALLLALAWPAAGLAETVEYIHTDALGSPVAITDAAGNVIERTVYEPYGGMVNKAAVDGPGFTGHVADSATGLSYMQQRYYDPQVGRLLSVDPVMAHGNPLGAFNRYWYANDNPYRFTDPDGRQTIPSENKLGSSDPAVINDFHQAQGEHAAITLNVALDLFLSQFGDGPGGAAAGVGGVVAKSAEAVSALTRAREIQGALKPITQSKVTTAVTETAEGVRVVTSSEGRLRPAQRAALQVGEVAGKGAARTHAEVNGVNAARDMGLTPTSVSPSRTACPRCQEAMKKLEIPIKDK